MTLPPNRQFFDQISPRCQILKRGAPPLGGGEVVFTCPITKVALLVSGGHDVIRFFFFPGEMWR